MGKIIAYCREECHHSMETVDILSKLKNKYNIDIKYIKNNEIDKNNIKNELKQIINDHNTFPIIIYETTKRKYFLIGGNTDIQNIIELSTQVNSKEDILKLNLNKEQKRVLYYLFLNK